MKKLSFAGEDLKVTGRLLANAECYYDHVIQSKIVTSDYA